MKKILFSLALLASAGTMSASILYDLNGGLGNLNWNGVSSSTTSEAVYYGATSGLNGSGAFVGRAGGMTTAYNVATASALDWTGGEMTMSLYFYFDTAIVTTSTTAADRSTLMGFKDNGNVGAAGTATNRLNGAANSVFANLGGGRSGTDPNFTYSMQLNLGVRNASSGSSGSFTSAFNPTTSGWYFWEASFNPTGGNNWSLSSTVYTAASDGTVGSSVLTTSWSTANGPTVAALSNPYAGIQFGENDRTGFQRVDNITAIPEPSTYAALAGLLVLGLVMVRRRK